MSLADSLRFIARVRDEPDLAARLTALGRSAPIDAAVSLGSEAGLAFTAAELRAAHRHDWAMRWARHAGPARPARPAMPNE